MSSSSPPSAAPQQPQQSQQHGHQQPPSLSSISGPLYALSLPTPLLARLRTMRSVMNEPYPSVEDVGVGVGEGVGGVGHGLGQGIGQGSTGRGVTATATPTPTAQEQAQAQAGARSTGLSIRFPKARTEGDPPSTPAAHRADQHPSANGDDEDGSTATASSDDEEGEGTPAAYASIGAGPNAPFVWLDTAEPSLANQQQQQQQQFGVHRSLFTLPPINASVSPSKDGANADADADDFPANHLRALQVEPIIRPRGLPRSLLLQHQHRGGAYALSGRTFKGEGVQDAARRLGFRVMEGEGYVAGLGRVEGGIDEEGESTEEEGVAGAAGTDGTDEEPIAVSKTAVSREGSDGEAERASDDDNDAATTTAASALSKTSSTTTTITPLQHALFNSPPLRTWTIILLGGGHFAAAVIALNPFVELSPKLFPNGAPTPEQLLATATGVPSGPGQAGPAPQQHDQRALLLLAHKTIHRYTTRRKQGGAQSTQDASGKFAKSAGAQLRRYGEQSLREEIRGLLGSGGWRALVGRSERVWVRAGARAASGVLWNWPGTSAGAGAGVGAGSAVQGAAGGTSPSPLDAHRAHGSLVSIPIQTRKPTLGECVRVWAELVRVRVRGWSAEELVALEEGVRREREKGRAAVERRAAAQKSAASSTAAATETKRKVAAAAVLTERERTGRDRFGRMVDMVRKDKVDLLVDFLGKYEAELVKPGGGWGASSAAGEGEGEGGAVTKERASIDTPLPLWWRAHEAGLPLDDLLPRAPTTTAQEDAHQAPAQPPSTTTTTTELLPTSVPSTLLQLAADAGAENVVQYLLIERRADPTLPVLPFVKKTQASSASASASSQPQPPPAPPHRTAYDLASTRSTRDVFRRLMAEQPAWYDWGGMGAGGARVPSALTGEMEERREGKVRERRNVMREKARAREVAAAAAAAARGDGNGRGKAVEEATTAPSSTPTPTPTPARPSSTTSNRLGGGSGGTSSAPSALRQAIDSSVGVTPEMRARIEREKRARAAEARMKALQGQGQGPGPGPGQG